jgi:hypothetical protein
MKKRMNHDAGFKARVALEAVKGERTLSYYRIFGQIFAAQLTSLWITCPFPQASTYGFFFARPPTSQA